MSRITEYGIDRWSNQTNELALRGQLRLHSGGESQRILLLTHVNVNANMALGAVLRITPFLVMKTSTTSSIIPWTITLFRVTHTNVTRVMVAHGVIIS